MKLTLANRVLSLGALISLSYRGLLVWLDIRLRTTIYEAQTEKIWAKAMRLREIAFHAGQ